VSEPYHSQRAQCLRLCVSLSGFFIISCFLCVWMLLPFDGEIKMYIKSVGNRIKQQNYNELHK